MPYLKITKEQCCHQASPEREMLGLEDRPLVLGKPNTALGYGTRAAAPRDGPSLGMRSISGTASRHSSSPRARREWVGSAALSRQSNFTKKGTWSTSVHQAGGCASSVSIPLGPWPGGGGGGGRGRKMATDMLLCTGGSGPAQRARGSQPAHRRVGRSKRGFGGCSHQGAAGLWWGISPSISQSCCPVALTRPQGMNPPLLCLCPTHALGHHTQQGPLPRAAALSKAVLATWIISTYYSISLYSCAADGLFKSL